MDYKPLTKWVAIHPYYCLTISPAADPGYVQVGMAETSPSKAVVVSCGLRLEIGALLTAGTGTGSAWLSEMGDHVFLLAMFGFSWNGPPFHISFQMCIKSFWGCLAGCHIHFQRLDKLCRGQCGRCIYWYHFYWVEAVKQFDFPSSRLSHTVGICLTQCCAGIVTAVEILYLNMKPLDHHSPGISIWSSDIFWSCAKFHPVPVPRSYQASDCSAFVTHFSFSVVGAIRTLLAGDGNHLLSPPKRFRWVKTISIPATNHAVCWGTRWLPILSSSWWCSISSIPSCPSWSPVEDSSALQPVLHPTYIVYKMNMNIYV